MVAVLGKCPLVASSAFLFLCLRLCCFSTFFLVTRLVREWVPWVANFEYDTLSCSAGGVHGLGVGKMGSRGENHHGIEGMRRMERKH